MLRQLGKNRIFLGRQMDVFAVSRNSALHKIDRDALDLDRLLVRIRLEVEQVGDLPGDLRRFRSDRCCHLGFARTAAPQRARRGRNGLDRAPQVAADR